MFGYGFFLFFLSYSLPYTDMNGIHLLYESESAMSCPRLPPCEVNRCLTPVCLGGYQGIFYYMQWWIRTNRPSWKKITVTKGWREQVWLGTPKTVYTTTCIDSSTCQNMKLAVSILGYTLS